MKRLCVALLVLVPAASFQDKNPDDEAKAVMAEYREKRRKAKTENDITTAIGLLKDAKPHRLIRTELAALLESRLPHAVREAAAEALGTYRKDIAACDVLLRRAREERGKEATNLRKRCLRSIGDIAQFAKSVDLHNLYADPDHAVARAAVEATEKIKSVRSLRTLVALWGELDRIRDDEGGERGPGVPAAGEDNDSRKKRKEELLEPVKGAVKSIFEKLDSKRKIGTYLEANNALGDLRGKIKEAQAEEDEADRKP